MGYLGSEGIYASTLSSVPDLHEKHEALSFDGWIRFMDVTGGHPSLTQDQQDQDFKHERKSSATTIHQLEHILLSSMLKKLSTQICKVIQPRELTNANLQMSTYTEKHLVWTRVSWKVLTNRSGEVIKASNRKCFYNGCICPKKKSME